MAMRMSCSASLRACVESRYPQVTNLRYMLLLAFGGFATATHGGGPGEVRGLSRIALANTGRFATQVTEVIKLRAAHMSLLHDIDVIDNRRVQRKNSFDADAETRFTNGDGLARAPVLAGDADAFKCLQTFLGF